MPAPADEGDLVTLVRAGWEALAAADAATLDLVGSAASLAGRFSERLTVAVSPGSRLCPPGWVGIVVIGNAALITAPDADLAARLQGAIGDVQVAALTDPLVLRERLSSTY
jgi:hypothetical protein